METQERSSVESKALVGNAVKSLVVIEAAIEDAEHFKEKSLQMVEYSCQEMELELAELEEGDSRIKFREDSTRKYQEEYFRACRLVAFLKALRAGAGG